MKRVKIVGRETIVGAHNDEDLKRLNGYFEKTYSVEDGFAIHGLMQKFDEDCPAEVKPDHWDMIFL